MKINVFLNCSFIFLKMSETHVDLEEPKDVEVTQPQGVTNGEIDEEIKELAISYDAELKDFPQIRDFVERLKSIIRRQQKKIKTLKSKLKDHVRGLVCQRSL